MNTKIQLLAADIGATNSRFAVFEVEVAKRTMPEAQIFPNLYLRKEHWLQTKDYKTFSDLLAALQNFSQKNNFLPSDLSCACIAAPGPVEGQLCHPPNINWVIDSFEVSQSLGLEHIFLINDFVAQGYACMLARSPQSRSRFELETIWQAEAKPHKSKTSNLAHKECKNLTKPTIAILGAGSGLGKAIVLDDLQVVLASEGGHADFPFIGAEEFAYAKFLKQTYGIEAVENDQIINGAGLARLYYYHSKQLELVRTHQSAYKQNMRRLFSYTAGNRSANRPACEVAHKSDREVAAILQGDISQNPKAQLTLEWYARFYGRVCKNFALDIMALGGLYITGGMAYHVPVLQHPAFLQSMQQSKTQKKLLEKIPVFHIQSQQAGLRGAALFGALQYLKTSIF